MPQSEYEEARHNLERVHYEVDYIITHCALSSIEDTVGDGGYVHDRLTDFLEEIKERTKFQIRYNNLRKLKTAKR